MVNSLVLFLGGIFLLVIILIAWKKPEVLKKDIKKPLSLKNLSLKKTFIGDWKSFGTWMLLMFLVWSYAHDTTQCREIVYNLDEYCREYVYNNPSVSFQQDFNFTLNGTTKIRGDNQQGIPNTIQTDS